MVLTSIKYKQCLSTRVGCVNNIYYLLLFLCVSSVPAVRMYSFHDYREKGVLIFVSDLVPSALEFAFLALMLTTVIQSSGSQLFEV